jgi:hypothetical protein
LAWGERVARRHTGTLYHKGRLSILQVIHQREASSTNSVTEKHEKFAFDNENGAEEYANRNYATHPHLNRREVSKIQFVASNSSYSLYHSAILMSTGVALSNKSSTEQCASTTDFSRASSNIPMHDSQQFMEDNLARIHTG